MSAPLPAADNIARILGGLLGRTVKVKTEPWNPAGPGMIAVYRTDDGKPAAAMAVDMAMASGVSAALSLMPAGAAAECARSGKLGEPLLENFHEICNVCSRLFMLDTGGVHLKLKEVTALTPPPKDVDLKTSRARMTVAVDVQGYGVGKLALFSLA